MPLLIFSANLGSPASSAPIAPYEWSFPYHTWLVDELAKECRTRLHLPGGESLHIAHVFVQLVNGWMSGATVRSSRWQDQIFRGTAGEKVVLNYFARLEYQDGRRKEGTQQYHGSGRVHLHALFWLDKNHLQCLKDVIQATPPSKATFPTLRALVDGSQPSNSENTGWPIEIRDNDFDEATATLIIKHRAKDQLAGLRAYNPKIMEALRCHQDIQMADQRGLLLKYVASYAAKWSDSFAQEWLNDEASDYSMVRKILFDWHPLEPEMILQMSAQQLPASMTASTTITLVAPYPGMSDEKYLSKSYDCLRLYEACTWKGDNMTFLEYLRKTNAKGSPVNFIKQAWKHTDTDKSLHDFARDYECRGEKLVAFSTYWRMNDIYYGQWLAMHEPFDKLSDLVVPMLQEKVPTAMYHLAAALHWRADHWRNMDAIRAEMEIEALNSTQIDTVVAKVMAETHLIDKYLSGELIKGVEPRAVAAEDDPSRENMDTVDLEGRQQILETNLKVFIDQSCAIELEGADPDKRERRPLAVAALGPPGCGKTFVAKRMIRYALRKGGKVLMALPTGQLASRMRQEFGDEIDIDTCHGAFLLHRPEQEALPCLQTGHVLVVVDEFPQLSKVHFERIMRAWEAAGKIPTLLFAGDFQQLRAFQARMPRTVCCTST